jgi:hypothetical protein
MEYRYAKWDEQPDQELVRRHEREIFPLMRRRHLFADVNNFLLYDFFTPEGFVNENVFAYSNRFGDERALVVYHNKYESAHGWVRTSVAYSVKAEKGDSRKLAQKTLGEGLELHSNEDYFCIFRDHVTGLEYIRNSKELFEKGLYVELGAYKYQVFIDLREVRDNQWNHYARIAKALNGRGVPSIEEAFKEMLLQPLQEAFKELVNVDMFHRLTESRIILPQAQLDRKLIEDIEKKTIVLLYQTKKFTDGREDEIAIAREVRHKLETILYLPIITSHFPRLQPKGVKAAAKYLNKKLTDAPSTWGTLFSWVFVHALGKVVSQTGFSEQSRSWIDEWKLDKTIAEVLTELGLDEATVRRSVTLVKLLTSHQRWFDQKAVSQLVETLLKDREVQQFLLVNRYSEILWFNKEAFEELLWWLMLVGAVEIGFDPLRPASEMVKELAQCYRMIQALDEAKEKSEYQIEKFLEAVR